MTTMTSMTRPRSRNPEVSVRDWLCMHAGVRTKVTSRQVPLSGRSLLFTTIGACHHLGVLAENNLDEGRARAEQLWGRDIDRFLLDVRVRGLLDTPADSVLKAWPSPVIGWVPEFGRRVGPPRAICTDLGWTLAVLTRVVGTLLLPQRPPTWNWNQIFHKTFALDDVRLAGVAAYVYPEPTP
jgi:hypothetical protein